MEIVRKYLTPDEVSPPNQRYNETTDTVQMTPDGGTTWVDVPELDPRHADGSRLPAGSTTQCDAAARMVAWLHQFVDAVVDTPSVLTLANTVLPILSLIPGINLLIALILTVCDYVISLGQSTIDAAFTSGVYDDLLCIIYCNIGSDGQMSAGNLLDISNDIDAAHGGVVSAIWSAFASMVGEVGFSDAGASGSETGDCAACDCGPWCWEWTEAEIYAALSWTVDEYIVGEYTVVDANSAFTATITDAEFDFEYRPNEGSTYDDGGGSIYDEEFPINPIASNAPAAPPGGTVVFHDAAGFAITELHMYSNSDFTGGSNYPLITRIRITGLSPRPGFANGSACV